VNRVSEIGPQHLMLPAELDHVRRTLDGTWASPLLGTGGASAPSRPAAETDDPLGGPAVAEDKLTEMVSAQEVR
jgi:hypothetical protein